MKNITTYKAGDLYELSDREDIRNYEAYTNKEKTHKVYSSISIPNALKNIKGVDPTNKYFTYIVDLKTNQVLVDSIIQGTTKESLQDFNQKIRDEKYAHLFDSKEERPTIHPEVTFTTSGFDDWDTTMTVSYEDKVKKQRVFYELSSTNPEEFKDNLELSKKLVENLNDFNSNERIKLMSQILESVNTYYNILLQKWEDTPDEIIDEIQKLDISVAIQLKTLAGKIIDLKIKKMKWEKSNLNSSLDELKRQQIISDLNDDLY